MEHEAMIARALSLGAKNAAVLPVAQIHFDRSFRDLCAANACGNYGRCWMCPPDAGDIDALMATAQTFSYALVYQTVGTLEDSYDFEGMMEAGRHHNTVAQSLSDALAPVAFAQKLHLGAGGCRVCETCAKRTNEPCRFPERAMASLETYGVAVSELAEACGMRYINGQNTVTYFGAFLFTE